MGDARGIVGYLRVSTQRQKVSGLGLESQEAALKSFARENGYRIIRCYVETESGRKTSADRPQLARAIGHARRSGAKLVIAKLDRLARNVHFVSGLLESGSDFICVDNPHANKLTIHLLAAFAEHEREEISKRTKSALQSYRRRGGLLGGSRPECRNLTQAARRRGARAAGETARRAANEAYADLAEGMLSEREAGATLQEIANALNRQGHTTRRGCPWSPTQVSRVLARYRHPNRNDSQ
jgi:DNA invertase Pin-like site-specific DNA recombinase